MDRRIHIRVLIVDDDDSLCRKLRGWLESALYEVTTFVRADEALPYAGRVEHELALVDLRLGEQDGVGVIEALAQASPSTCILAMTAFPEASQVIAAVRAGARDLLEKPIQQPILIETLERCLTAMGVVSRDETEFNRRLGKRLRTVRQQAERTLEQIAESVGITQAQLSQIELGKTATSTWTLARICAALRVPLGRLFEGV
ncbi:MAG: response regulator [Planctomycetes bacterium]|nr:response regulator [Planctomycetota bacterium]